MALPMAKNSLYGVMKLKTLCVGGQFGQPPAAGQMEQFPAVVLRQTNDFRFFVAGSFEKALRLIAQDQDIDLVFVDADYDLLPEINMFITQAGEIRPKLPVIVFTSAVDDRMRYLMREGAAWHFNKQAPQLFQLSEQIQKHVFSPVAWPDIFSRYASDAVKPRIEPGLSASDLVALSQNPEERYIVKRLFAASDVVQIFRMDDGFSGSRIYRVKPTNELRRILKIDAADRLEMIQEKQDSLIQPRLNQRVGQIQGRMVHGRHLAGACYALAGSRRDAVTLTQFLQDQNRLRRELIDGLLKELQTSLEQLYIGSSDCELRYWAPLYSRVLPPHLTLADAVLVEPEAAEEADFTLLAEEINTLSSVPGNSKLQAIHQAVRQGETPTVTLGNFEVAELDTVKGVIYLHDDLLARYPAVPLLKSKEHPILRFKVGFAETERELLTHPLIRRGKRVTVRGRAVATQETILADNITAVTNHPFSYDSDTFQLGGARFISPVSNARFLLWEVGREDMIVPIPQLSPVVHGDFNTTNILVEAGDSGVSVWLIDFSDARPGHIYFDLAKLEMECRTHVLYRLYKEMIDEGLWDDEVAFKFALLVEEVLWQSADNDFTAFIGKLREHRPVWYDALYSQFPLYAENLFYFLFSLRQMARLHSPERFQHHYPVAIFFQATAALKFKELNNALWWPWAKRLALCASLVAGKRAVRGVERPLEVSRALNALRAGSAFALITVGSGEDQKYLLQWNPNWDMFNLVGGRLTNEAGDRDSFARTIQRKLLEELGLHSTRDYRIVWEYKPLYQRQFSQREHVFKEYEFHVFKIEFLPRHPLTAEEYDWFAQRLAPDRENILVSRGEIERLRTLSNRQISATTRLILRELGEIKAEQSDTPTPLEFLPDSGRIVVSRGRAQFSGELYNPQFADLIENMTLELLPSRAYEAEKDSAVLQVAALHPGQSVPVTLWLRPRENEARVMMRATYYDARGHEQRQILETAVQFDSPTRSAFHIDNPYVVGKPLTAASESLYIGREDIFRWIEENLIGKTQPHTLILYGQRRMGKTSTLYQLVGGQRGKNIREYPGYPIFPVYIDLQRLAGCQIAEFFDRLSREVSRNLSRRDIDVPPPATWSENGSVYRDFDDFLDLVEASLPPNGLLVLIMDELEQLQVSIERGRLNQDILPYLRSLMQHRSRMTFILVGTNQLVEEYWSSIFHVGISQEIVSLTRDETERLIRDPVAPMIQYDDLAIDRIWLAARGHPYFSQLICHRLISASNLSGDRGKVISLADVRRTFDQIIEEDDSHLLHLWNECSREEQLVLAALSGGFEQGEEAIDRPEIANRLRDADLADESLNHVLKRLEQRRLVVRRAVERELQTRLPRPGGWQPTLISKDYTYVLSFDLLQGWIARKRPLASLLD